jgi:hypothetical protein
MTPPEEKLVPLGIFILATGALILCFGSRETSDIWADCLRSWWTKVCAAHRGVGRLVIYLDNGPNNSGTRDEYLKQHPEFADWSGLESRLVYWPPYRSKYNPIERCSCSLQKKWNGTLPTYWGVVRSCAQRMTWKGIHPHVSFYEGHYPDGVEVAKTEMATISTRRERSETLPKYGIL